MNSISRMADINLRHWPILFAAYVIALGVTVVLQIVAAVNRSDSLFYASIVFFFLGTLFLDDAVTWARRRMCSDPSFQSQSLVQ